MDSLERPQLPDNWSILETVEDFRRNQFHYTEVGMIFLLVFYFLVFAMGTTGNFLMLLRIFNVIGDREPAKGLNGFYTPFMANLCLSDLLVIFSCCPFMMYSNSTSIWYLGSVACTFVHYVQGVAVTSNTLSMAGLSCVRYLFVYYPNIQARPNLWLLKPLVLTTIWVLSFCTSLPLLMVRGIESFQLPLSETTFEFCLEHWESPSTRNLYSGFVFSTVYLIPCGILLYCHASVSVAIKQYEVLQSHQSSYRDAARRSVFRRQAFKVSTSRETSVSSDYCGLRGNPQVAAKRKEKTLNKRRKRLDRLLIWTTLVFIFCWLPYNLVSLIIDLTKAEVIISILPFSLLLGHLHSAINPMVYWMLEKSRVPKNQVLIEMRCDDIFRNSTVTSFQGLSESGHKITNTPLRLESRFVGSSGIEML